MNYEEFKKQMSGFNQAVSVTGKSYTNVFMNGDYIFYERESGSIESISLKELFYVYQSQTYINTNILRNFITGRKFSPSLALLIKSGLYDQRGNKC